MCLRDSLQLSWAITYKTAHNGITGMESAELLHSIKGSHVKLGKMNINKMMTDLNVLYVLEGRSSPTLMTNKSPGNLIKMQI